MVLPSSIEIAAWTGFSKRGNASEGGQHDSGAIPFQGRARHLPVRVAERDGVAGRPKAFGVMGGKSTLSGKTNSTFDPDIRSQRVWGKMLESLTVIVLFEVTGDLLQSLLRVPIPGPVIGMALLLAALIGKGRLTDGLNYAAGGLLRYLPMMFVPAGVGVMAHFELIRAEWRSIALALVVSSGLAIVVTALTMHGVERVLRAVRQRAPIRASQLGAEGAE